MIVDDDGEAAQAQVAAGRKAALEEKLARLLAGHPEALRLNGQYLTDDDALTLAHSPLLRTVRILDLGDNQLGSRALAPIFCSPNTENAEELNFSVNFLTDAGWAELAAGDGVRIKNLRVLRLDDNKIGDAGAAALVRMALFRNLEILSLAYNKVGNGFAKALADSGRADLKILDLERNYLDDGGLADLLRWRGMSAIETLNLTANKLTDAGIKHLAAADNLGGLRKLSLSANQFGDAGAQALAASTAMPALEELRVSRNYFGADGVKALKESPGLSRLKILSLAEGAGISPDFVNYSNPDLLRPRQI